MATDVQKTVEIIFAGVDRVSSVMDDIGGNIDSFSNKIQDIGEPFKDAAEKIAVMNAAILGLGAAAIIARANIESEAGKMQAALGLPIEEAERFEKVAKDIYKTGLGDDLADSFEAVTLASQKFREASIDDIQMIATHALELSNVFGTDYNESLSAVQALMKNFGLSSEESFDFIVAGFQKGLDGSGDFLDSINEYSTQFSNGGADAGQFFSIMETGFQGGVLGTDKAADAFKEFRVRIQDGSKATKEALESIGIDPVAFQENLNSGKTSAIEAFQIIINKLGETEDQATVMQAGVGLIGTQFEDLGTQAALSLDTAKTKISDLNGAVQSIEIDDLNKQWTGALRTIIDAILSPEEWENVEKTILNTLTGIADSIGPAFEGVDLSSLVKSFENVWSTIGDVFKDADLDLTTVEGMQKAVQLVVDGLSGLANVTSGIIESFEPMVSALVSLFEAFGDLDSDTQELLGNIIGFGTQLTILGGVVSVGGTLIKGVSSLAGLFSSAGAF